MFIDGYDKTLLNRLPKNICLIYRVKNNKYNLEELTLLKYFCKSTNRSFYISNNVKLAKKINCDGVYISAYNRPLYKYNQNQKKRFNIIGGAHSISEILIKQNQGVKYIFLSPIFKNRKNRSYLNIIKFNLLSLVTKSKIIALGGINNDNIRKLKMTRCIGFAAIKFFKDEY